MPLQQRLYRQWAVKNAREAVERCPNDSYDWDDADVLSPIMAQTPADAAEGLSALFEIMSHWTAADFTERAPFVRHVAANAVCLLSAVADRLGPPSE